MLVRDPGKAAAKALAAAGAEIAAGDLAVPATINAAMDGVSAVILVSPAVPAQELNVVASAARAGVAHVVKATSKASADSPIARRRGQAEFLDGRADHRVIWRDDFGAVSPPGPRRWLRSREWRR